MDGKARMGVRNWDFSGQPGNGDSIMKPVPDVSAHQGSVSAHHTAFLKMSAYPDRHSILSEPNSRKAPMDFGWVSQQNFLAATKSNLNSVPSTQVSSEMTGVTTVPATQNDSLQNSEFDSKPTKAKKQPSSTKKAKRVATKVLRTKEPKKQPSGQSAKKKSGSVSTGKREKRNPDITLEGMTFDFSGVPAPVCSCTGVPHQCYRWGAAGWQSSCCTTTLSEHPLPMSSSRPGARLAGRKMSIGAYGKLLQRLAVEGCDLSNPVDLKAHWARHGTNKFVTIR
uniref:GAGA-binding transcriptional activator n=1 Tax=Anthurium amnicola TaxID=1678845 RepID=A0A1D1ZJ30_9ARAE